MKLRNKNKVKQVLGRDLGICRACGFSGDEVHHIKPLFSGGDNEKGN